MGISVTIQTYNRAEELRATLRTLAHLETSEQDDYELIVVDNNSSDHTPQVVRDAAPSFGGRLRYIHESRQGLSHARNRAIAEARYEIVAFLDDDVSVDPAWLRNLAGAFSSGEYAAIGGRALLVYPSTRPAWLGDRTEGLLTKMDYGMEPREALADELYGVNLSIRKKWLGSHGGFRTDLGRVGKCLLGGEETELLERIAAAGGKLLYSPSVLVGHRVAPDRLRRRWFWSRCYWGYRGHARVTPPSELRPLGIFRWSVRVMRSLLSIGRATMTHGPSSEECFYQTRVFASRLGYWVGLIGRCWNSRPSATSDGGQPAPSCPYSPGSQLQHQTS